MKTKAIKLLDTVALLGNIPARKLRAGEVGTVVELLDDGVYEVEFCDEDGQTYAQFALRSDQIMPLHRQGKSFRMAWSRRNPSSSWHSRQVAGAVGTTMDFCSGRRE
jgi:hypothetical protein